MKSRNLFLSAISTCRNMFVSLGAIVCVIGSAFGGDSSFVGAQINWGASIGSGNSPVNPDSPGCCMCFNYCETWADSDSHSTTTSWSTGSPCTVYRDGVAIATVPASGDPCWFSDYDVEPGETHTYEILGYRGGSTGEIEATCQYIYKLDPAEPELSFAADDNYSKEKYAARLYMQTADSTITPALPWEIESNVEETVNWIWARCDDQGNIYVHVDPNETVYARTGQITIKLFEMKWSINVTQAGKVVTYSSWVAENGVTGAWNEKSGDVYNVFRYVFGVPEGDFEVITGIEVGESKVVIKTPEVANSDGVTVNVVESSDVAGETVTATKAVDASGSTEFTKSAETPRFYRVKAEVTE